MASEQRLRTIAVFAAVVAVVMASAAVIVVLRRSPDAPITKPSPDPLIPAAELVKLRGNTVAPSPSGGGMIVTDEPLRTALGLQPQDIITAISGRPIKREFDMYDAMLGVAQLGATAIYVELLRDGHPVLLHWSIDGDLNKARRAATTTASPFSPPHRPTPYDPFGARLGLAPDPVLDTVVAIDDTHAELPRATAQRLLDDPTIVSGSARLVPSVRNGEADGFKLYAIRPSSFYAKLNLANGDTVRAINGYELTSPDRAREAIARLASATTVTLDVMRRGQPLILTITVK